MRDDAFKTLGDTDHGRQRRPGHVPGLHGDSGSTVTDVNGPQIKRRIRGTYTVPCFLTNGCLPGGDHGPRRERPAAAKRHLSGQVHCIIPPVGLAGQGSPKLRPFVFGHGLLGNGDQVQGSINPDLAQEGAMIACATDEIGMASEDLPFVAGALTDFSNFSVVPDRLQQGLLDELFLARLMYHPGGLGTVPAFQDGDGIDPGGSSVIRTDHVYYMGASQGGHHGWPADRDLTGLHPVCTGGRRR